MPTSGAAASFVVSARCWFTTQRGARNAHACAFADGFLKEILDRPENERPFLLIPVGYPAEDAEVPQLEKKALDEIADFR